MVIYTVYMHEGQCGRRSNWGPGNAAIGSLLL